MSIKTGKKVAALLVCIGMAAASMGYAALPTQPAMAEAEVVAEQTAQEEIMFGANCFTGEHADALISRGDKTYTKLTQEAGYDYLYRGGKAMAGESYLFSGTLVMSLCAEDATAEIVLQAEEGFVRFFLRYNNPESYSLVAWVQNGAQSEYRALAERDSGRMNFLTVWHGGSAYLYIDNTFITKVETPFARAHLGFGGAGCRLDVERLSVAENADTIQKLMDDLKKPFGRHMTGDADYYEAIFFKTGENEYEKRSYHYLQTFCYLEGKPVAGDYYWVEGSVQMRDPDPSGQVALMVCNDENNKVRFVLARGGGSGYRMFSDQRIGGAFTNYRDLGSVGEEIEFKIIYDHGVTTLYIGGELRASVTCDMGVAHFGVGGDNCKFVLRDLRGGFDRQ